MAASPRATDGRARERTSPRNQTQWELAAGRPAAGSAPTLPGLLPELRSHAPHFPMSGSATGLRQSWARDGAAVPQARRRRLAYHHHMHGPEAVAVRQGIGLELLALLERPVPLTSDV